MVFIGISIIILCLINLLNVLRINKLEKLVNILMKEKIKATVIDITKIIENLDDEGE